MGVLDRIQQGPDQRPRRVLLYGVHGIGKSTFASRAPSPVFVPTEDGLGGIGCDRFPLVTSYDELLTDLVELYEDGRHEFRTVVIDSADWLEKLIWNRVCEQRGKESIEDFSYGKGYTFALDVWREVLDGLDALRNERGMMVLLLAHARIERFSNPETETYDRYGPRLHRAASALIQEWCDEVLFAGYRVHTRQTDEGFDRVRTRAVGSGDRILRTTERPAHVAKNRLGLPEELPLDFDEYAKYLPPLAPVPAVGEPA